MMGSPMDRRRFWLAAATLASLVGVERARAEDPPTPRVARLDEWRDQPGLGPPAAASADLESQPLGDRPPGRYPIDGDRMFLTIAESDTRDPESARFETHRKYIDLHPLIRGGEMIGSMPASHLRTAVPCDPEAEVELFDRPPTTSAWSWRPASSSSSSRARPTCQIAIRRLGLVQSRRRLSKCSHRRRK